MTDPVLVADIGGTNARFALAVSGEGAVTISNMQSFRAADFETIRDAVKAYLDAVTARPKVACFAVAGPVTGDVIAFTNARWRLEIAKFKAGLTLDRFLVVNDFEALASGVRHLQKPDFTPVKPGFAERQAPVLVIGPGTGLGQALIVPCDGRDRIIPTEGGHIAFAPQTDEENAVIEWLARTYSRVSVERLLSGRGLVNIYDALNALNRTPCVPLQADEITQAAMTTSDPIAVKAIGMFCDVLGAGVGDAVLSLGARGGVVLGGGILPKIREMFLKSRFVDRFLDKGRMRAYVEKVPVDLIVTDGAALIGAAAILREQV